MNSIDYPIIITNYNYDYPKFSTAVLTHFEGNVYNFILFLSDYLLKYSNSFLHINSNESAQNIFFSLRLYDWIGHTHTHTHTHTHAVNPNHCLQ